jgi:hypothetical protein
MLSSAISGEGRPNSKNATAASFKINSTISPYHCECGVAASALSHLAHFQFAKEEVKGHPEKLPLSMKNAFLSVAYILTKL